MIIFEGRTLFFLANRDTFWTFLRAYTLFGVWVKDVMSGSATTFLTLISFDDIFELIMALWYY